MSSKKIQSGDSELGERIKAVRTHAGINQNEFAKCLKMTTNTINRYEKGHRLPDAWFLTYLVDLFNVDAKWLLTGKGEMFKKEGTPEPSIQYKPVAIGEEQVPYNKDFVSVPRVSGAIGAGSGRVPNNNIEVSIAFRKDWIERKGDPRNMSLIKVSGDSMAPTFISGDLVLVDHNKNYIDPQGGLYAIVLDDGIMIKRIQVMYPGKKLKIASDNLNYQSIEVDADLVTVNGKVIWFGREIDR